MNETIVEFHFAAIMAARHWFGVMKNKEPIMAAASIDRHVTVLECFEGLSLRDYRWVLAVKQAVVVSLSTPLKDSIVNITTTIKTGETISESYIFNRDNSFLEVSTQSINPLIAGLLDIKEVTQEMIDFMGDGLPWVIDK